MTRYGVVLDGKLVRICKSLNDLLRSEVYKPWYSGCHVYKFTYDSTRNPVNAEEVIA